MRPQDLATAQQYAQTLEINRVLRNTYLLLSLTLLFSALTAGYAVINNVKPLGILVFFVGWFGLYFATMALRNSAWGLLCIFAFTGFVGYTLGPIINMYLHQYVNGGQIVTAALASTGLIFLGLSGYALVSRQNFSYLGGFIAIAAMAAFILGIGSIVFHWEMVNLLISGAFTVISGAFILFTTSQIITGGERNYLMATISLYIAIFNLFVSLLRLLSFFAGGNRN